VTPEHAHLILVHLPLVGLFAAVIPLTWGALRRDRTSTLLGLVLAGLFALTTPLVTEMGERAEERLEHATGPLALDREGARWLHEHEERAETGAVVLYIAGGLFVAGVVAGARWSQPAVTRGLAAGGLVLCVGSIAALAWVADAGGKIRHPELREGVAAPAGAVLHDD
jgi:hypothetical protein